MTLNPEIIFLYRYFAYAAHMRSLYSTMDIPKWLEELRQDEYGLVMLFYSEPAIYLQYSYAGIYLVIEGYRDLGLHDPDLDELLASPFVDRLRLFRNATFHYQKDLISMKHLQFFGTEEEKTEQWIGMVYKAFERFFQANTIPIPEPLKDTLHDKSSFEIAQAIRSYWKTQE
jgi:vacuolar-type H+-ATPase subunit C/Vma6